MLLRRFYLCKRCLRLSRRFSTQSSTEPHETEQTLDRKVLIAKSKHWQTLKKKPEEREDTRLIRMAILGAPNAGKSVLMNSLVGATVSPVSKKVHTTQSLVTGVMLNAQTQVVVWDTPGVLSSAKAKKHKLERSLLEDPEKSLTRVDMIAVLTDVGDMRRTRLDPEILHLLYRYRPMPTILVMNKGSFTNYVTSVDLLKRKEQLLPLTNRLTKGIVGGVPIARKMPTLLREESGEELTERLIREYSEGGGRSVHDEEGVTLASSEEEYELKNPALKRILTKPLHQVMVSELRKVFRDEHGWPYFEAVFMISALHGEGLNDLKKFLLKKARPGNWMFHKDVLTSQDPISLTRDLIRSKLLDELPVQIPYSCKYKLMVWEINENDVLTIRFDVICPTEGLIKRLVGTNGVTINRIAAAVNQELRNVFQRDVYLKLGVTSEKKKSSF